MHIYILFFNSVLIGFPKYIYRSVLAFIKSIYGSVLAFLKSIDGSILALLKCIDGSVLALPTFPSIFSHQNTQTGSNLTLAIMKKKKTCLKWNDNSASFSHDIVYTLFNNPTYGNNEYLVVCG